MVIMNHLFLILAPVYMGELKGRTHEGVKFLMILRKPNWSLHRGRESGFVSSACVSLTLLRSASCGVSGSSSDSFVVFLLVKTESALWKCSLQFLPSQVLSVLAIVDRLRLVKL